MSNPFYWDWEDYFMQAVGIVLYVLVAVFFILCLIAWFPDFLLYFVLPLAVITGVCALYATFRVRRQSKIPKR